MKDSIKKTKQDQSVQANAILKLVILFLSRVKPIQDNDPTVKRLYDYCLRIMSSRLSVTVSGDELHLVTLIQKRLAKQDAQKALRFSNLYVRVCDLGILKKRWSILYLLLSLGDVNANQSENMSDHVSLVNLKLDDAKSSEIDPLVQPNTVASVFGAFPRKHQSIDSLQEKLIRDLIFVFQGIDGDHIRYNSKNDGYEIHDLDVTEPLTDITNKLCELGWLYRKIQNRIDSLNNTGKVGLCEQSFLSAIREELRDYYRLIAILEAHVESKDSQKLTLKRVFVWTSGPLQKLRIMSALLDVSKECHGGNIITMIHGYAIHGDPIVGNYISSILSKISLPFYSMIQKWITKGELEDPYNEFFVAANPVIEDDVWKSKFSIKYELVPGFIPKPMAKKIFLVGKSLYFIRNSCEDASYTVFRKEDPQLSYGDLKKLEISINTAYKKSSAQLCDLLFTKYKLLDHFDGLRRFFLLAQGDFVQNLMDSLGPILSKPAVGIYRHNLTSILESSLRACSLNDGEDDITQRLDVRLLEASSGDVGWDVFALEYHVNAPINSILTPQVLLAYLKIFTFLWKLKRIEHVLGIAWRKRMSESHKYNSLPGVLASLHKVHLLGNEMSQFVFQLQHYMLYEGVAASWEEFNETLQKNIDLDQLINAHHKYLNRITTKCFLVASGEQVMTVKLVKIFDLILSFDKIQEALFKVADGQLALVRDDFEDPFRVPRNAFEETNYGTMELVIHALDDCHGQFQVL